MVKGRYVGQIEFDFEIDLEKAGNVTFEEFRENLKHMNDVIEDELRVRFEEYNEDIKSSVTVTQQYLDAYEVGE